MSERLRAGGLRKQAIVQAQAPGQGRRAGGPLHLAGNLDTDGHDALGDVAGADLALAVGDGRDGGDGDDGGAAGVL